MDPYFFPNQSPDIMRLDERFRAQVARLDEAARLELYAILSAIGPTFTPTTFSHEDGLTVAHQADRRLHFPSPTPVKVLSHILCGYEEWLRRKYCLPGFVEVEPDDVVIDCGAYVAGFSLSAARLAKAVHVFEPDRVNYACVTRNFAGVAHVHLNHAGLYSVSGRMPLNVSSSSVEHSLLPPDDGEVVEVREIQVLALADYCRDHELATPDFVKIEAEGVELEVFEGLGELRPRKLAIDVSPERNNESPAAAFHSLLADLGYETRQRAHVLFARTP